MQLVVGGGRQREHSAIDDYYDYDYFSPKKNIKKRSSIISLCRALIDDSRSVRHLLFYQLVCTKANPSTMSPPPFHSLSLALFVIVLGK
jgi:hypothetical protein